MKKIYLLAWTAIILLAFTFPAQAQRGMIKRSIQKDMKEKHAEPQKEKGRKELEDVTYENDTRYPVPENPVKATLAMETKTFKKNGKLNQTSTTKIVFGDTGECLINNEGDKNENRMLFDYKGAAMYMIDPKQKTATKMPMINFQKLAEKLASSPVNLEDDNGKWERTNEQEEINGFNCRKYIYINTKEKTKVHAWVTQNISIDLSGNHLFGGQIMDFSKIPAVATASKLDENVPNGMMVRSVYFEKNHDSPSMQMDITSFKKISDPAYFDLSDYEISDVLGKL